MRVVSLCPSTTETVLGLIDRGRLAGRTDFCTRPAGVVTSIPSVGGTKRLNPDAVSALDPDLILSVREENDHTQIAALAARWPVLILDPVDIETMLAGVRLLGRALDAADAGAALATRLAAALPPPGPPVRVVYLIWRKPYMAAGAGTYIGAVLAALGLVNAAAALPGRYPELTPEKLAGLDGAVVLAASEPFPFGEKHVAGLARDFAPARPLLVDGEAFGWHGIRLLDGAATLARVRLQIQELAEPDRG